MEPEDWGGSPQTQRSGGRVLVVEGGLEERESRYRWSPGGRPDNLGHPFEKASFEDRIRPHRLVLRGSELGLDRYGERRRSQVMVGGVRNDAVRVLDSTSRGSLGECGWAMVGRRRRGPDSGLVGRQPASRVRRSRGALTNISANSPPCASPQGS